MPRRLVEISRGYGAHDRKKKGDIGQRQYVLADKHGVLV